MERGLSRNTLVSYRRDLERYAAELAEAQRDMQQLARDIAAADASPAALRRRLGRKRTKIGPNPDPLEGPDS